MNWPDWQAGLRRDFGKCMCVGQILLPNTHERKGYDVLLPKPDILLSTPQLCLVYVELPWSQATGEDRYTSYSILLSVPVTARLACNCSF